MNALTSISPRAMREILELHGYRVVAQDDNNFILSDEQSFKPGVDGVVAWKEPVVLPKHGELLAPDIMLDLLVTARLDMHTFNTYKARVVGEDSIHSQDAFAKRSAG